MDKWKVVVADHVIHMVQVQCYTTPYNAMISTNSKLGPKISINDYYKFGQHKQQTATKKIAHYILFEGQILATKATISMASNVGQLTSHI